MATAKKTPITIYLCGGLGASKMAVFQDGEIRDNPRRPGNKIVQFIEKGKRKPQALSGGDRPMLVVLAGHGHPEPPAGMIVQEDGSSRSKYGMFDPRYEVDFNVFVNAILPTLPPGALLLDQRYYKEETPPARPTW